MVTLKYHDYGQYEDPIMRNALDKAGFSDISNAEFIATITASDLRAFVKKTNEYNTEAGYPWLKKLLSTHRKLDLIVDDRCQLRRLAQSYYGSEATAGEIFDAWEYTNRVLSVALTRIVNPESMITCFWHRLLLVLVPQFTLGDWWWVKRRKESLETITDDELDFIVERAFSSLNGDSDFKHMTECDYLADGGHLNFKGILPNFYDEPKEEMQFSKLFKICQGDD